ncbi:DUF4252 domain-containing protein [Flavobacterium silvaticum]|uniref:DUF4252 domain-containing protein n=1 Tax=Flavobacterium silvaticum TaxID=1852020 RepID=A0A972FV21_9FLAO|nr:DUF4252 domain-containing protein [Flavobacterium silvaticum]NMH28145.1 DUF4252 domain-containing protein [Flavobacterium silvaticum]
MKKVVLTIALMLMPILFFGQTAFDKFDGQDDVTTVVVTPKMFKMMGSAKSDESQEFLDLVKKLTSLKVFTTKSVAVSKEMKATADGYIKTSGLEELMRVTENGQNIKIMVKTGTSDTNVRELFMFIDGTAGKQDTVLLSLTGNFDLNDVSTLTEEMKFPGGDKLNKASKGSKGPKGPKGKK